MLVLADGTMRLVRCPHPLPKGLAQKLANHQKEQHLPQFMDMQPSNSNVGVLEGEEQENLPRDINEGRKFDSKNRSLNHRNLQ